MLSSSLSPCSVMTRVVGSALDLMLSIILRRKLSPDMYDPICQYSAKMAIAALFEICDIGTMSTLSPSNRGEVPQIPAKT